MLLTEIKEHLKQNKAPYILGLLVSLLTPLFLVIWQRWLYGLLAQRGQAIPRQVLGAVIGVLLILLLALFALVVLYARELSALKNKPVLSEVKDLNLEENDIAVMRCIASYQKTVHPSDIADRAHLHLQVVKFHIHRLVEAEYVQRVGSEWFSLGQRGREYLIKNKLIA